MPRSLKKGPHVNEGVFRKVMSSKQSGGRAPVKVWDRACTIVPEFVGINFEIHNGRTFVKLYVTEDMVGHKLGEFAPSRVPRPYGPRGRADGGQ